MEVSNVAVIVGIIFFAVFLVIARKLLRLAFKLILAGFVFIALLVALSVGWYQGWFNRASVEKTPARPSPTRRVASH